MGSNDASSRPESTGALRMTTKTDGADRELLELAAKAAGLWDAKNNCIDKPWSPLTDDGDALRLAVRLKLWIQINHMSVEVECWQTDCGETRTITQHADPDCDYCAVTRCAIVRAAADIERNKS